jgi:hypothetical protein
MQTVTAAVVAAVLLRDVPSAAGAPEPARARASTRPSKAVPAPAGDGGSFAVVTRIKQRNRTGGSA